MDIELSSGVIVTVKQLNNLSIFNDFDDDELVVPQAPTWEQNGIEYINSLHPVWNEAMKIYHAQRIQLAFYMVLNKAVTFDESILVLYNWSEVERRLKKSDFFVDRGPRNNFLVNYATQNIADQREIVKNALLTEQRVFKTFNSIPYTRGQVDIHQATLKNAIDTGIQAQAFIIGDQQLVNPADEYAAAKEAMMSWDKWIRCEYELDEKASAVAMYRLDRLVSMHNEDAVSIESERRSKQSSK